MGLLSWMVTSARMRAHRLVKGAKGENPLPPMPHGSAGEVGPHPHHRRQDDGKG